MQGDLDRTKEFIRRLFNVAEDDAASQSEIEQAMRLAQYELARHQLTRDDVFQADVDDPIDISNVTFEKRSCLSFGRELPLWETELANLVSKLIGTCQWYYTKGAMKRAMLVAGRMNQGGPCYQITFYGPRDDAQFCVDMFGEISLAMVSAARLQFGKGFLRGKGAAYCEGFVCGLRDAHYTEREKLRENSRALIDLSDKRTLVIREGAKDWLSQSGVRLTSGRGRYGVGYRMPSAKQQGRTDGREYALPGRKSGHIE